jgi:hypothetical protein
MVVFGGGFVQLGEKTSGVTRLMAQAPDSTS